MNKIGFSIFVLCFLLSCQHGTKTIEELKQEVLSVEKEFCEMTAHEGMAVSFPYYAADSAVLKRGEKIIKGKQAIVNIYAKYVKNDSISLVWEPDFVDVSTSGDMAYTYGEYSYSFIDSLGIKQLSKGIFHTVWKRQENGEWKYVFD